MDYLVESNTIKYQLCSLLNFVPKWLDNMNEEKCISVKEMPLDFIKIDYTNSDGERENVSVYWWDCLVQRLNEEKIINIVVIEKELELLFIINTEDDKPEIFNDNKYYDIVEVFKHTRFYNIGDQVRYFSILQEDRNNKERMGLDLHLLNYEHDMKYV